MKRIVYVLIGVTSTWAMASDDRWVTTDWLNVRTCASTDCGVVSRISFRQNVKVQDQIGGWARISKYYDANCQNGISVYVDSGEAACTPENGITNEKLAEWVSIDHLSDDRPSDPSESASEEEMLTKHSDDFIKYRVVFTESANSLIEAGTCRDQDFLEMGGWLKSSNQRDKPVYFTYCRDVKIYLNAATGETSVE